jgi:3-deoxy-manno-octulosonate cytidylyltransferase (CMP-KDO synthetase)
LKIAALIPARYASTRLPATLVQDLGGLSVIQRTYQSTVATGIFDAVWVVTDHDQIQAQIQAIGGNVVRSINAHESGSDRIAEALGQVDADLIVNVQGDEPFQDAKTLQDLVDVFANPEVQVASLMCKLAAEQVQNPNFVKVVVDEQHRAIYFSRSPIPYNREGKVTTYWKHIGVYAYRRDLLLSFTQWPKGYLEQVELLEQLRLLEKGVSIQMVETTHQAIAIDTQEDLDEARKIINIK